MARYAVFSMMRSSIKKRGSWTVKSSVHERPSSCPTLCSQFLALRLRGRTVRRLRNPCPRSVPPARGEWQAVPKLVSNAAISASLTPPGADHPAQTLFGHLERRFAREDPAHRGQRGCVEAPVGLFVQLVFCQQRSAASQAARALCIGDQLAQAQQNVLVASQTG